MKVLDFGAGRVAVTVELGRQTSLDDFLAKAAVDAIGGRVDLRLVVIAGDDPGLQLDHHRGAITLTVPRSKLNDESASPQVQIALLQAAARCLDCVLPPGCLLLHGSTTELGSGGHAAAVLDGGRGQGKTSLAFGLARSGGRLLADEFTYLRHDHGLNVVFPAPRLPWHIRTDMAPHLAPEHPDTRLLFPSELQASVRCGDQAAGLVAVLIPDMSQPAGTVTRASSAHVIDGCLRPAVTDHRAKLLDPGLDHVSLFASLDQVTTPDGTPLAQVSLGSDRRAMQALLAMKDLPLFLVGIGTPADIEVSVRAARDALESL